MPTKVSRVKEHTTSFHATLIGATLSATLSATLLSATLSATLLSA